MTYIRCKLVLLYSEEEPNLNLGTEGKIRQVVPNFLKHYYFRSSHLRCSVKKGVLRNFAKFTGKHLCQRFFFNKAAGQSCNCFRIPKKFFKGEVSGLRRRFLETESPLKMKTNAFYFISNALPNYLISWLFVHDEKRLD